MTTKGVLPGNTFAERTSFQQMGVQGARACVSCCLVVIFAIKPAPANSVRSRFVDAKTDNLQSRASVKEKWRLKPAQIRVPFLLPIATVGISK